MLLPIVNYGHPALRQKGARVDPQDPEVQQLVRDMLETMHHASGIGLAAQQVARPLQLTVVDVRDAADRPSTLELDGQSVDPNAHMPMVLINPQITPEGTADTGPEGCLSFPDIYADITRPASVVVRAQNQKGEPVEFRAGGLLSRAIQHEYDHLQGILFIDRMTAQTKRELQEELDALQAETKAALRPK